MNKATETLNKLKVLLGMEVAFESAKLENGTVLEAESFEAGNEVFIVTAEEKVALPVGSYTMEDGKELVVAEEGLISEVKEANTEEAPVEEVPVEEEAELERVETAPKKVVTTTSEEVHFSSEELKSLFDEVAELKLALSKVLEAKATELSVEVEEEAEVKTEVELSKDEEATKLFAHNPTRKKETKLIKGKLSKKEIIFQTINNA